MNRFTKILKKLKDYKNFNFMVLGGAPSSLYNNNETYSDIDLFFENKKDFDKMFKKIKETYIIEFETDNAITLRPFYSDNTGNLQIQLVKRSFCSWQEHFDSFDINKSKIGIEFKNGKLKFLIDEDYSKDLQICKFHENTLFRLLKYKKKGYKLKYKNVKDELYSLILNDKFTDFEIFYNDEKNKVNKYEYVGYFLRLCDSNFCNKFLNDLTFYNEKIINGCTNNCPDHFWTYVLNFKYDPSIKNNKFNRKLLNEYPEVLLQF